LILLFFGGDTVGDTDGDTVCGIVVVVVVVVVVVALLWNMSLDALSNNFQPGERSDGRSRGGARDDYRTDSRGGLCR
jgi:hypothetical protein